jgi:hypothetical protein
MKKENIGSSSDDRLREEGIYEEVSKAAVKRVFARELQLGATRMSRLSAESAGS